MSGRGVLFALAAPDERHMLGLVEARARAAYVANQVEERWDEAWLYAIDQLWLPVHFCLHGSAAYPLDGAPAEAKAVFGGVPLGVQGLYSIDYKDGELVRRIASALARMREDAVWARAGLIERKEYAGPRTPDLQVDVVGSIHDLAAFYRKAADAARAVIFTVDL
jgi:hypothetical protein